MWISKHIKTIIRKLINSNNYYLSIFVHGSFKDHIFVTKKIEEL